MIFVTGGGGYVSREIVRGLLDHGQRVRVLVANPEEKKGLDDLNIEVVIGDRRQPDSFAGSLQGVDTALLLTRNAQDLVEMDAQFSRAAKAAGVKRIVKCSAFGADANAEKGAKRVHGASEEAVKQAGLKWTFIRPQFFMQNMLWFIDEVKTKGTISLPMKDGRVGMVDYRDLAAVAVQCLIDPAHEGQIYQLSGPQLISVYDIAESLTRAVGVPVNYNDLPPEEFKQLLMAMGRPLWHAEDMTVSYTRMSKGASAILTEDVKRVLGRPATPFEQVAKDYAHLFRAG
jgi:uncharacterized protein YbjT (DUF2867 family)